MKLYLIEAERDRNSLPTSDWFDKASGKFFCPSLSLPIIASLCSQDINVKIIDEKVEEIDLADLPDAVVINYKTMSSKRAYELALFFKEKKVKVLMGGLHASLMPEEAKKYCDSVVIGEAEPIWPEVVKDLTSDQLKPFYRAARLTDLSTAAAPRIDLLKTDRYLFHSIQSSRGCSLNCDFCPTREMFGGIFRTKPIQKVLEEIRAAISIEKKPIFFTDDIFGAGDGKFTLELLANLRKLNIEFSIISDFLVLNRKMVAELARSGCWYICLNLPGTCSKKEAGAIKMIQALGIDVWGYFMFGFRFHEKDVFEKAFDFVRDTGMKHVSFTVMAPYPNTNAGRKLESEGRILNRDWSLYDQAHVVFKPEKMTPEELDEGYRWIRDRIGHLSQFASTERRSLWKKFTGKCLAATLAMLPMKSKKS